jgi:hypothetical protein
MSTMNGNSYWSPPSRHTRCLGDRFVEGATPERRPDLEEFPFLVAKAIAAGLIRPPIAEVSEPVDLSGKPIADWRHITCIKCGQDFTRGHRKHQACMSCRLEKKKCTMCGNEFQPGSKKQACCSNICAGKKSSTSLYPPRALPIHACKTCQQPFTGRLSGAGWAKTCSDACANIARSEFHAAKRADRLAAKAKRL